MVRCSISGASVLPMISAASLSGMNLANIYCSLRSNPFVSSLRIRLNSLASGLNFIGSPLSVSFNLSSFLNIDRMKNACFWLIKIVYFSLMVIFLVLTFFPAERWGPKEFRQNGADS